MTRDELVALIKAHPVHQFWCDGCGRSVGRREEHLADVIMPEGVEYLLEARVL